MTYEFTYRIKVISLIKTSVNYVKLDCAIQVTRIRCHARQLSSDANQHLRHNISIKKNIYMIECVIPHNVKYHYKINMSHFIHENFEFKEIIKMSVKDIKLVW
jgi:hypothetical protein